MALLLVWGRWGVEIYDVESGLRVLNGDCNGAPRDELSEGRGR